MMNEQTSAPGPAPTPDPAPDTGAAEQQHPTPAPEVPRHDAPKRFGWVTVLLVAVLAAVTAGASGYLVAANRDHPAGAAAAAKYQCPMHPTIVQDHPGECPICGMKLVAVGGGASEPKDRKILLYRSPMDPNQTSPTPRKDQMGMDYVPVYEDEGGGGASTVAGLATIEIDPARQQLIGLKIAPVTRGKVSGSWRTFSKVAADEQRVRHIAVKVPVFVEHVYVNFVGKPVRKGEALFSGYSPELLAAQAEYQVALSTQKTLAGSTESPLFDGGGLLKASRRRLELLDAGGALKRLDQGGEPLRTLTFSSPIEGVVTKKEVVDGMKLDAGAMPYEIVDLSKVWVLADIYESDVHRVRVGMTGKLTLKAYPNRVFEGVSTFLDPVLDPTTRTVKMRLEFANPSGELKPGMFGEMTLETTARDGLRIPEDAVINSGTRKVVFVALGEGKLQPREVVLGESDRGSVEVVSGLTEGESVVVRANFLVDSESQLRASLAALMAAKPDGSAAPMPSAPPPDTTSPGASPTDVAPPTSPAGTPATTASSAHASSAHAPSAPAPAALYSCPMHPEVTDTKPSRCPKCGMTLTPNHGEK